MDEARRKAIEYSTNRAYKVTGKPPFPYSRKNPQPPIPAFRINIQGRKGSEHFRDKWFVNVQETPTGYTSSIWNSAKYAKYMRGTVKMIERPILSKVAEDVRSFRLTVEHDEIVKVMQSG